MAFPSPRRGPIFSTQIKKGTGDRGKGFRPHEGDPSSLLSDKMAKASAVAPVSVPTKGTHLLYDVNHYIEFCNLKFPSPRRGPIFSTVITGAIWHPIKIVSVPTKGTHLLYWIGVFFIKLGKPFPSPRRGPIFSTKTSKTVLNQLIVSVPTKGTHLLYLKKEFDIWVYTFPSPRRGPIFSTGTLRGSA